MNIKECFTSRFPNGYIIESDFSQLEVIGLACLTGDNQLIDDLLEGRDMHCISASFLSGKTYEEIYSKYKAGDSEYAALRKAAKQPSFQLQYGAGARSMADSCGLKLEVCKQFIDNYYTRYAGVKQWQEDTALAIKQSRIPTGEYTPKGWPQGQSEIVSWTGRRYLFKEYDAPRFLQRDGIMTSFSPTEMKNYPVQGFATGDIVPHMLGVLYRELMTVPSLRHKLLLINTIHDSVLFDCQEEAFDEAIGFIKSVLSTTQERIEKHFNITLPLGFKYSIEYGKTWFDMVEYK